MIRKYGIYSTKYSRILITFLLICAAFTQPELQTVEAQAHDVLYVTFIDVGQGDSALLQTSSGINMLIDGGPSSAGQTVVSFLDVQGVTSLDAILISHNHADHIGGLIEVLQSTIAVDLVLYNGNSCTTVTCQTVWAGMADRGIAPTAVSAGDTFIWGPISTEILNPQASPPGDENEDSIVAHITFSDYRLLFTGDIGFSTETRLIDQGVLSSIDVLKVAHHGSAYSTSDAFLNLTSPLNAVISVGTNNSYGHPSTGTLNRLLNSGASISRTDLEGNISFTFSTADHDDFEELLVYLPLILNITTSPDPGPSPSPDPLPGQNLQCQTSGQVQICASVSNANPPRYSNVTVYGRLVINDVPQANSTMYTTWHYKSTTSFCNTGITGLGGLASCEKYISGAADGYQVNVAVTIEGYSVTTSFTPKD